MSRLISSLPGKASRTLVELRGLLSDSLCVLKAEPGKLNIKRGKPGILLINIQVGSHFKLGKVIILLIFVSIKHHSKKCNFILT